MLLAAVRQLQDLVRQEGLISGGIPHALEQLQTHLQATIAGHVAEMEQQVRITITETQGFLVGSMQESTRQLQRSVDNANISLAENVDKKTTESAARVINDAQTYRDVLINAVLGKTSAVNATNVELTPSVKGRVESELTELFHTMIAERFSPMLLTEGFERLKIQDAAGHVFDTSIKWLFGPDGPIALVALDAAGHSPNFHPAMEVLFGPSGKVADAAVEAVAGTNLTPAEQGLEKKLEDGVTQALDQAGTVAKEHAAGKLTESISAGATALGNAMTAIPQLHESVKKLGEAWDKPLNSTEDYMNLLTAAGGAVSQAGQVMQAFSGITQVAAAAQAVFNAVMALNPVVLVVIAVVALIAMIALLITYWDQVKAALRDNPWLAVAASLFGIIGLIVVIIAYWDEIKLAVLVAANYISIQLKRIGFFFVGLGTLIGQVWDWITATVANVGIAIVNAFISAGVAIENFFIGVINWILGKYNDLADSALGDLIGLEHADLIPEVDVQTKLIPPKEVPTIDVDAAFKPRQITGGLESQIAAQEKVVAEGQQKDADRRAAKAAQPAAAPAAAPAGDMGGLGRPALPAAPGGALPGGAALPEGVPAAAAARGADQSVRVEGGINVTINAERLEADSAKLLTDEFIAKVQARLGELRATQDFRVGARPQQA